jgi:hypothetical protein
METSKRKINIRKNIRASKWYIFNFRKSMTSNILAAKQEPNSAHNKVTGEGVAEGA